jgi:hypothetical protein
LVRIYSGKVKEIIVLYNDRLRRFGFELLEFNCKKAACRIVVYSKAGRSKQAVTRELSKVLSIVIVFVTKNIRLRGRNRKIRQKLEESQKEKIGKTKKPAGKSIMIRLYCNKSQRENLNKWFGTARWTYNQVIASLRASPRDISKYAVVKELRKDFVNNKNSNHEENFADKPWVTKAPYDVRDAALNDVVNAYTSNLAKEDKKSEETQLKDC